MKTLERRRSRQRRKKELRRSRRIILAGPAARSRTIPGSRPRTDTRSNSTTTSRTRSRGARVASSSPRTRRCRRHGLRCWSSRLHRQRRRHNRRRLRRDNRLGSHNFGRGVSRWSLQLHELKPIAARPASAATRRTGATSASCGCSLVVSLRDGNENQQNDECMHKKRGGDTLPPPLSLARYADRWPIGLSYWAGVSFGETPMTFTPAPRATSIAKITSEYFALGSPFTKMIFSGRGS
jgi:hypothetical protein